MILIKKLKKLPDAPGVYFFKNSSGKILYIGKATSLRDRVRSYFSSDLVVTRGPLVVKMINEATKIDFQKTDSVLEALILEANLIKKHQPSYNTREKDDKSFNYVLITKEEFPRLVVMRGREIEAQRASGDLPAIQSEFGPFTQGSSLQVALKIIRKIFPYRDRCEPRSGRPCFNRQIGLCPGVCTGEIGAKEYAQTIKHIKLFFGAKKKTLIKSLEREMRQYAKNREFEKADKTKKTIFALKHIQDIALIKNTDSWNKNLGENSASVSSPRIEAYDIAHIAGRNVVGVMVVIENGEPKKSDYRKFKIRENPGINDTAALQEVLRRRFTHSEWPYPQIIVVDGGKAQINAAKRASNPDSKIAIVSVVKDERHKPKQILGDQKLSLKYEQEILLANNEAHRFAITYHRKLQGKLK